MAQQTAVEWLEKELKDRYSLMQSEPLFQQAKEMHKEQIVDALETGWVMGCSKDSGKVLHTKQYYKETYGK